MWRDSPLHGKPLFSGLHLPFSALSEGPRPRPGRSKAEEGLFPEGLPTAEATAFLRHTLSDRAAPAIAVNGDTPPHLSGRMGTPPTRAPGGTSRLTKLIAETTAPSPTVTPGRIVQLAPIVTRSPITTGPRRHSRRRYSCPRIVVLYPMIVSSPMEISSGKNTSIITIKAIEA